MCVPDHAKSALNPLKKEDAVQSAQAPCIAEWYRETSKSNKWMDEWKC